MDKVKRYIETFRKNTGMNRRYCMNITELFAFAQKAKGSDVCNTVCDIFEYGYAKGYRACQAKMKKNSLEG